MSPLGMGVEQPPESQIVDEEGWMTAARISSVGRLSILSASATSRTSAPVEGAISSGTVLITGNLAGGGLRAV